MKWTFELVADEGYIRVATRGTFNARDVRPLVDELVSQPYWEPERPILIDNRKLTYGVNGTEEMREASKFHIENDARLGRGKLALLMKSIADFGLGRQYEILTDENISANIYVFLDESQALRWLLS